MPGYVRPSVIVSYKIAELVADAAACSLYRLP
jgi:hypothetical protein